MNKRTTSPQMVELSPLDAYISNEGISHIHQDLMRKLNVTFINKSKEPTSVTLAKIKSSTKKRNRKSEIQ